MRWKVLLGPAPELPIEPSVHAKAAGGGSKAARSLEKFVRASSATAFLSKMLLESSLIRHALKSAARNRCSGVLLGNQCSNVLLEVTVRSHMAV